MRRIPRLVLLAMLLRPLPAAAQTDPLPGVPAPPSCDAAAAIAEREFGLPDGLLAAIGRVESGRFDPLSGRVAPWPWTTNAAGQGHYFNSRNDAVAWLRDQQLRGVASIDVGCFQVNLLAHPAAFAAVEDGFDPLVNARYAARFLAQLYNRSGGWENAVALYHSADPGRGGPYRGRVLASWSGADLATAAAPRGGLLEAARSRASDPYVTLLSERINGVRVWVPRAASIAAATPAVPASATKSHSPPSRVSAVIALRRPSGRLPRVITP